MTEEKLARANELRSQIKHKNDELKNILDWLGNIGTVSFYGIKPSSASSTLRTICPTQAELKTILLLMKERCEEMISEWKKEFEAL